MRSVMAATLYPGVGLLEFCNVSVGRGTDRPFELFGAPYIDDLAFAAELRAANLPGLAVVPVRFTPRASVFSGKECGGVQFQITDREAFRAVDLGITLALILQRLYPAEAKLEKMERLLVHPPTFQAIRAGQALAEIQQLWTEGQTAFAARRKAHLLYEPEPAE